MTQALNRKPFGASPKNTAAIREAVASLPPPAEAASPLGPGTIRPEELPATLPFLQSVAAPAPPAEKNSKTPERNLTGGFSIARQLGLGVSRIVIDPGHGGHDPGATGKDVSEAELVLDVSLRLEKLLQKIPGIEVVLTRRTDEFVTLQERTAIANREGADLFLSIHANASDSPFARGVETYFLNFANNLGAAGVAARENAASGQAMAALPDLVKMIALNNKLDESRDLATIVQHAMIERLRGVNKSLKDLGVKQAPFAVLIGAAMPSVLAEVSFVTNTQDAKQLRSSAYRQRIAEALTNAVRKYQTSLKSVSTVAHQ
jgi:N-acetylmuramoyl-L-alanine amidase